MNYVQELVIEFVKALDFDPNNVVEAHITPTEVVIVERLAPALYGAAPTDRVSTIKFRAEITEESE